MARYGYRSDRLYFFMERLDRRRGLLLRHRLTVSPLDIDHGARHSWDRCPAHFGDTNSRPPELEKGRLGMLSCTPADSYLTHEPVVCCEPR
jgi:hypothetical protein